MPSPIEEFAERRLRTLLKKAQKFPKLKRLGPKRPNWKAELKFVSSKAMSRLNATYRKKNDPTDILSFPSPRIFFQSQGLLGELVVCRPTLNRQARERGHSPDIELEVLLVHGILHLLGMDHEKGGKAAQEMALWEKKLLTGNASGLIARES